MHRWLPPPAVAAFFAMAMWAVHRWLPFGHFAFAAQRALAVVLLFSGLLLMAAAVFSLAKARTTVNPLRPARASNLVTSGVFGMSRNPIYLGDVLILAAWALWLGAPLNFVLLGFFIGWIDKVQIRAEERALQRLFERRYATYCARVRRWL